MKYILCIIYLFFSIFGLTFMKIGNGEGVKIIFQIFGIKFTIPSMVGYCSYIVSFLLYIIVISKFELSYIYPVISGISNILILFIALLVFQEKITFFSFMGILFIAVGVVFINIK